MKSLIAAATLASTVALAVVPHAGAKSLAPTKNGKITCTDNKNVAKDLSIRVEGETATARFAVPKKKPTGLVVFDHGYGHTSASWVEHMKKAAAKHGVIAVTPDYRGAPITPDTNNDGLPESRGWDVMAGAEDTIALAKLFDAKCPSIEKIIVLGVSMGGNTSGLAVAMSKGIKRSDGKPLFDYWVDVEGAVNVTETYFEARVLAPANDFAARAVEDIEKEMGGTFEENPEAYQNHTVVARIEDIKASGVKGVVMIHGVDDGLVPYNQAREMKTALTAEQIPNDIFTVGREDAKTDGDTSLTGYAGSQLDPNYDSPIAGHASEKSEVHIVMTTAFGQLWSLFEGNEPGPAREFLVDGEAGTVPLP